MSFDLIMCSFCGKAFVGVKGHKPICDECKSDEDSLYKKVRTLIRDHPDKGFTVPEVARLFDVEECKINYFVGQGMFQLSRANGLANSEIVKEFLKDI
ncbi:MAG: hypothetical protein LBT08_06930 [Synergistaceae bacterium]|nr:hypothetical protein [Synergistaceae bacterium]